MEQKQATIAYILAHCRRYPALQPEDLLKALHQSVFGCGHFVSEDGLCRLLREAESLHDGSRADVEMLHGDFCRVHLGMLQATGLRPETLFQLFRLSAETPCGSKAALEEKLLVLQELAEAGELPFPAGELAAAIDAWREAGFSACHHSDAFRQAYKPAYRVIRRDFARFLPLFAAIDRKFAEKGHLLVALEGGAASGKSTLGALLQRVYDCNLFHADDYFLQPHQRTAERLAEVGGNLDRERLEAEILRPVKQGQAALWRRYDCHDQQLCAEIETVWKPITVLEGAYSLHPQLAQYYDLSAFLRIDAALQAERILHRNGPEMAQRFFDMWIPMEQR